MSSEWKTIESAPKTGSFLIAWKKDSPEVGWKIKHARHGDYPGQFWGEDESPNQWSAGPITWATHWMPLPNPPSAP